MKGAPQSKWVVVVITTDNRWVPPLYGRFDTAILAQAGAIQHIRAYAREKGTPPGQSFHYVARREDGSEKHVIGASYTPRNLHVAAVNHEEAEVEP